MLPATTAFAAKQLNAKALRLRIATVLSTAACFFMSHFTVPVCCSASALYQRGFVNPVTPFALVGFLGSPSFSQQLCRGLLAVFAAFFVAGLLGRGFLR